MMYGGLSTHITWFILGRARLTHATTSPVWQAYPVNNVDYWRTDQLILHIYYGEVVWIYKMGWWWADPVIPYSIYGGPT
jgi:ABC-type long-subunit fatty acid transport system fused permease/ATPase subunit